MIAATKILIVEDDGIIAEDISENLTRLGYLRTAIACDGRSAVDMALEMRPDIVLMDIKLRGDLDGIQAAEQIRRRLRSPIVYLTANAEPDTLQRAKTTEPFGYLLKPYKAQELRRTIEMALFKNQMKERLRDKQMEEKLRHSQKMEAVGRLASGVAHDFNNLLSVIRGHTTRILDETGDEHLLHRASQIRKATERAISLTHQLLMVSRKPAYEPKIFDLRDAVGDLYELLRSMISSRINLKLSVPEEPALIRADPGQIEQVLMNLALNARDSMAHGGTLTVDVGYRLLREPLISRSTTVLPGDYVVLAVSDTGSGMDPATLERIFEPFFTTKEKGKGTGLGLTAVYTIVDECDAGMMVESALDAGSRFTIYFPRQTGQEYAVAAQA
jgi:two-component system, cell cycle sensor histidine kinase and response regulator CckA